MRLEVEMRSVNARFLEVRCKHPFSPETTERITRWVKGRLGRGRVEVLVRLVATDLTNASTGRDTGPTDEALRAALKAALRMQSVAAEEGVSLALGNAVDLVRSAASMDGGRAAAAVDLVAPAALEPTVHRALDALASMRAGEGEALETVLRTHLDGLEAVVKKLRSAVDAARPREAAALRARVEGWLEALGAGAIEPARLQAEVAAAAARSDVAEELDRLESHLEQARGCLAQPAARGQGKTLDFLCQEMGRELTTTGSKLSSPGDGADVIEGKGVLERLREQVQNVE